MNKIKPSNDDDQLKQVNKNDNFNLKENKQINTSKRKRLRQGNENKITNIMSDSDDEFDMLDTKDNSIKSNNINTNHSLSNIKSKDKNINSNNVNTSHSLNSIKSSNINKDDALNNENKEKKKKLVGNDIRSFIQMTEKKEDKIKLNTNNSNKENSNNLKINEDKLNRQTIEKDSKKSKLDDKRVNFNKNKLNLENKKENNQEKVSKKSNITNNNLNLTNKFSKDNVSKIKVSDNKLNTKKLKENNTEQEKYRENELISLNPDKNNKSFYQIDEKDPIKRANWNKNEPVPYSALSTVLEAIEKTSSRLAIQDILTDLFVSIILLSPDNNDDSQMENHSDLLSCLYLCLGTTLAPPQEGLVLGVGDTILMKSIQDITGQKLANIKKKYQRIGDLGTLISQSLYSQKKLTSLFFSNPQKVEAQKSTSTNIIKEAKKKKINILYVSQVYKSFLEIAKLKGNQSQDKKVKIVNFLLMSSSNNNDPNHDDTDDNKKKSNKIMAKFIIRGLQGKLRIGLANQTLLTCLSLAFSYNDSINKLKAIRKLRRGFSECPDYGILTKSLYGLKKIEIDNMKTSIFTRWDELKNFCHLRVGLPVSPMLAFPTKSVDFVFKRFDNIPFVCEYKYDGERIQIHYNEKGQIFTYSRNFEDSTERFPDIKNIITQTLKKETIKNFILDAEVVAYDRSTNQRLPFQVLSTRSRKNVNIEDIKVSVCLYAFDLLFVNDTSLLDECLYKRREQLYESFNVKIGYFEFAESIDIPNNNEKEKEESFEKLQDFLLKAINDNCEGLMIKTLQNQQKLVCKTSDPVIKKSQNDINRIIEIQEDIEEEEVNDWEEEMDGHFSTYDPARRSHKWLKLKKDYINLTGLSDSLDLVPIGAYYGKGKRTGMYGGFLLANYDPTTEMYQVITKIGSGFSDEQLKLFYNELKSTVRVHKTDIFLGSSNSNVADADIWFEPSIVWEIKGADLSISPKYTAAYNLIKKDKGISLRFPRFIRERKDKKVTESTTSEQIAEMYKAQGINERNDNTSDDIMEDDDDAL